MLGRRNPQRSFFDAQSLPHRVPQDSFYGRMGAVSDVLFQDEDLADMYCVDNGRPSLPPSLMSGVILLQFYDDVPDAEAVERTLFDMRWKVALNLPLDYPGFDSSSLTYFRKRLLEHGKERYAFDRFVQVGRAAGFIPDKVTLLVDTTATKGAGAVQDTYTLLRKGTRKLLKAMGYRVPGKRRGLAPQVEELLSTYLDENRKAEIDWSDPAQRSAQLKVLVQDAEAALELATDKMDDPEVRTIGWLLTKILGDDLEQDEEGEARIAQGTAPDRVISLTDTEMRHGRKSAARRFDGFKVSVATEQSSELILDIADMAASERDGKELMPTVERVERHTGVAVERVIADGAYNSGENLAACANHPGNPVDLISPFKRPTDPEVDKSAFEIDLEAKTAICPQGQIASGRPGRDRQGLDILRFQFSRQVCEQCPLFNRCVRSKTAGRSVRTNGYEVYLRAARRRSQTKEIKLLYRTRGAVERKISETVRHGVRNTRYVGQRKRQLQRLWIGAAVNLKRLFKLAQSRGSDFQAGLATLAPPAGAVMAR
jgi:transposase